MILQDVMGWATGFFILFLGEGQQKTVSTYTDFDGPPPSPYFMTSPLYNETFQKAGLMFLISKFLYVACPLALSR